VAFRDFMGLRIVSRRGHFSTFDFIFLTFRG